jgi:hypothetical protein
MTGRVCYGLELSPAYVDVIVRRGQIFTAPQDIKPPVNPSTSAPAGRTKINQELQMARTAFVVNDALREKVRHLAGLGTPQDDIAKIVGCASKTLRRHFRDELDRGAAGGQRDGRRLFVPRCEGGQHPGDHLLAEDEGALARAQGCERPSAERRGRVHFRGPHPT